MLLNIKAQEKIEGQNPHFSENHPGFHASLPLTITNWEVYDQEICQAKKIVSKILLQHFIFHLFLSLASRLLEGFQTRNGDMVFWEDYDR